MTTATLNPVTAADREYYQAHGYIHLKGVLPQSLLDDCQAVLEAWVETMAKRWHDEGKITDLKPDLGFDRRFNELWHDAGMPPHERSPRGPLVRLRPREMFDILQHPALLDAAAALLDTDELISHGIWNSRPKCPDARFTDTPMHQDAQYFPAEAHSRVMTAWFPLHAVDAERSCLAVTPDYAGQDVLKADESSGTGFIGIGPDIVKTLEQKPIAMQAGDLLCFTALTPHGAMPNKTDLMRWSMDMRFVPTATAHPDALNQGITARSADPAQLTGYDAWRSKW